jgi:hypothetical protein
MAVVELNYVDRQSRSVRNALSRTSFKVRITRESFLFFLKQSFRDLSCFYRQQPTSWCMSGMEDLDYDLRAIEGL